MIAKGVGDGMEFPKFVKFILYSKIIVDPFPRTIFW